MVDFIAVSESTPGPLAINMATFVGIRTGGVLGAVCATLGVVLPSFLIILIVAKFYEKFRKSRAIDGVMYGLRPAVIGLIGAAFLSVGKTVYRPLFFRVLAFGSHLSYLPLELCLRSKSYTP